MKAGRQVHFAQQGFMLLEALIAIVIFSFGVLAIVGLQAVSIKNAAEAKYRTEAAFLANEMIGRLWADRSKVVTGYRAPSDWTARVADRLPAGTGSVGVAANASGRNVVTVTVGWTAPGGTAHEFKSEAQIFGAD